MIERVEVRLGDDFVRARRDASVARLHPDAYWRVRAQPPFNRFGPFEVVPVAVLDQGVRGYGSLWSWVQPMSFHSTTGPGARGVWEPRGESVLVPDENLWPQTFLGGL